MQQSGNMGMIIQNSRFLIRGFKNSDTQNVLTEFPCAETIATKDSDVGEYDIIVSGGEAQNYEITCRNGMLTIVKAMLSVKADNVEREYGDDNPEFKVSYQGFRIVTHKTF